MITTFPPIASDASISGIVLPGAPAASTAISAPAPALACRTASWGLLPAAASSKGLCTSSAPTCRASACRTGLTSNAITRLAPAARASAIAANPIGPVP